MLINYIDNCNFKLINDKKYNINNNDIISTIRKS